MSVTLEVIIGGGERNRNMRFIPLLLFTYLQLSTRSQWALAGNV